MNSQNIFGQVRRGLDRAGFEADRMMRYNRVRAEAGRLRDQVRARTLALGEKVLDHYRAGQGALPDLSALVQEIRDLEARARQKDSEAEAVQHEQWADAEPRLPPPGGDPQIGAATAPGPRPRLPGGGDPQIGAAGGPAPPPVRPASAAALPHAGGQCPTCGAALRPHAAFCANCGMKQR